MRRAHAVAIGAFATTVALAQSGEPLPATLSGRWTAMTPRGPVIDSFTLVFDGERAPGTVPGRLTWRGVNCGAKDEPIQALWNGTELKFEAVLRANTNTQMLNSQCANEAMRWTLVRKAETRAFEGEGRIRDIVVTVRATP